MNDFFGGESLRNEIIRLMRASDLEFKHVVHESTPTSEDSAKVRGTLLEEGIKSLILKGKSSGKNYQFNLPSHLKLDMKIVEKLVSEKCEFEDPSVILERYGLVIGGVPPFGGLLGLKTFFDEKIKSLDRVAFNCGLRTESIIMKGQDLVRLVSPEWGAFSK